MTTDNLHTYLSIDDIEGRGEIFLGERETKKSPLRKTILACTVAILVYIALFACLTPFKNSLPVLQVVNPFNIVSLLVGEEAKPIIANSTEVFEVKAPLVVPTKAYTAPYTLFNETVFSGSSISVDYEAPKVFNYTDVLFDLNFTVAGTQEPVIFEVYVDDSPIWRTSSPNPLGALANSSTVKNVTEFLPLFAEDSVISLQLIDGAITGDVNVSMSAVFYNDTLVAAKPVAPVTPINVTSIFYPTGPADFILPLSNKGLPFQLPKDSFSVSIPQVAENVTVAKVKFFASASEEETRFYSSAINGPTGGASNGPIRNLNVYLNSIFVGTVSPNPTVLKPEAVGQDIDASCAWSPLAALGSFDALAYEIDLTAVLPLLWEDDSTLTIEVVSPVKSSTIAGPPSIPGPVSPPGVDALDASKWLISGNFFAWSSALVNASVGDVLLTDSLVSGTGILIAPPFGGIENQIVRSTTSSGIQSQLNFTLADGSLHNLTYNFNTSSNGIAIKNTRMAGVTTKLVYISTSKYGVSIEDDAALAPIYTRNVSYAYPLTIEEVKAAPMAFGPATNNSLNISIGVSYKIKENTVIEYSVNDKMNATIDDLSYSTEVSLFENLPSSPIPFQRDVIAENGIVTKDTVIPKFMGLDVEEPDLDFEFEFGLSDEQYEFFEQMVDSLDLFLW